MTKHVNDSMSDDRLDDADYERIARYLAGELTRVERAETDRWILEDADRRSAVESMRAGWQLARSPRTWNVDGAWNQLSARLAETADATPARSARDVISIVPRRHWWQDNRRLMQVAATAVIVAGTALLWPSLRSRMGGGNGPVVASNDVITVTTKSGERRTIDLPDGSRVVLGFSSSLTSRPGYGRGTREVDLGGEAYFTVQHDSTRPFRVHVGSTVIEDLGTEFAVRAYAPDKSVRVAVESGSVAVRRGTSPTPSVVLSPRDVAFLEDTGEVRLTRGVDVSTYTAWTGGRLVFNDTPLAQVAEELERWYGVEVRVTDSTLLTRHLTTAFESESLDEVLRVIGMSLDVRYVRRGKVVEFTGSGAATGLLKRPASRVETGA